MVLLQQQQRPYGRAGGALQGNNSRVSPRCLAIASPRLMAIERRAKLKEELNNPVKIGASGTASSRFKILPAYEPLQSYMLLPVEQYFVLDPKQIAHLGGNRFVLSVPRINIFNLYLDAVVEVTVTIFPGDQDAAATGAAGIPGSISTTATSTNGNGNGVVPSPSSSSPGPSSSGGGPPRVLLRAENCRIGGCEAVEALHVDQRFSMSFETELTWSSRRGGGGGSSSSSSSGNSGGGVVGSGSSRGGSGFSFSLPLIGRQRQEQRREEGGQEQGGVEVEVEEVGEIRASSQLEVWSEVVSPFHLLPREVLAATCNGVLRGLVASLLPLFVRMLAQDYEKWAQDPAYRAERAARSSGGDGSTELPSTATSSSSNGSSSSHERVLVS